MAVRVYPQNAQRRWMGMKSPYSLSTWGAEMGTLEQAGKLDQLELLALGSGRDPASINKMKADQGTQTLVINFRPLHA